ncbi:VOC family protein [Arthrobacter sp. NPDC090010]|uniref:VOC family protein n=1 Tax=Arthrobacter sp. NPDC090010 TaxID=3363942 RepID=UPI003822E6A7
MASTLNPYINFVDNAREALEFYRGVLGGELRLSTFGEFPGSTPDTDAEKIMHGQLTTQAGFTLMAADTPAGMEHRGNCGFSVSLSGDDETELRGYWDGLSEGAQVILPLEKQMWGDTFGMLVDRFGIGWMVDIAAG